MNAPAIFNHPQFGDLRIVDCNGKPWFIGNDAAKALGYTNPQKALRDHCKGVNETFIPSAGGQQKMKIIPEADLFRLIMRSKLPDAEAFQDWVVEEVLPAIRERGEYAPSRPAQLPVDVDSLIAMVKRLELAEDRVDAFRPRVPYGTPNANGDPRTSLVPAFFRGLKNRVIRQFDEYQRRLFDFR